jgi:heme exporter protein D
MIPNLGPHAAFIWTSYGAAVLVLAVLVAWLVLDGRRQRRRLADLEARGHVRRSARERGADVHAG